jgi:hypothetical protein
VFSESNLAPESEQSGFAIFVIFAVEKHGLTAKSAENTKAGTPGGFAFATFTARLGYNWF